jgi:hypothetical protein
MAVVAAAWAIAMAFGSEASAAGWAMRDFETPDGDPGHSLIVPALRVPGVWLSIACDGVTGSRWRALAVVEDAERGPGFGMRSDLRFRIGEGWTRDAWKLRTAGTERRIFMSPEPTRLARRLLRAEQESKDATFTVEMHGVSGKPILVTFPIAGLGANIEAIEKKCDDWELKE